MICRICRFETEIDDVVLSRTGGRCVCLRCYDRETGGGRRMSRGLRRQLTAVLASI